jgi:hypothetical protein
MKKTLKNKFPPGWDEARVKEVIDHYDKQTEDEAMAEDQAAYEQKDQTFIAVPTKLVSKVRELIAKNK